MPIFIAVSQISLPGYHQSRKEIPLALFGGIISIIIIQVGGLGIVLLLVASYWVIIGKKIGLKERNIIAAEQNQFTVRGIIRANYQCYAIRYFCFSNRLYYNDDLLYFLRASHLKAVWRISFPLILFSSAGFA